MMRMLRYLGLAVFVVCIAAFASGCGGGGGGTATPEEPPVVVEPEPTEPTDAERIAAARQEVANILSNAQARAGAASSAAAAIQTDADATPDQITNAISHSNAAQSALALIVSANTAATLATTPEQANAALESARAAQGTLNESASAISGIQGAVQAVANQRQQREADEMALTGGSSLIRHLRDNKLLADAVRTLATANIVVGDTGAGANASSESTLTGCTAPCAEYRAVIGPSGDRSGGVRTVRMQGLVSDSTTPPLSGTGRLSNGFDLKNAGGTTFVNIYTDIDQEAKVRNAETTDDPSTDHDELYNYVPDADYLIAGIWLSVGGVAFADSAITAFARGSQPLDVSPAPTFCTSAESAPGTPPNDIRVCNEPTSFSTISGFVADGKDMKVTYRGNVNGAYIAGGETSDFRANVELTAEFQNPTEGNSTGSIEGDVTNITAGGQSIAGSIELQKQELNDDISGAFEMGKAFGVIEGKSYGGEWKGHFYGIRAKRLPLVTTRDAGADPPTTTKTTTYSAEAPGSVAGTFYVNQQSEPNGAAAFIGAFGANR